MNRIAVEDVEDAPYSLNTGDVVAVQPIGGGPRGKPKPSGVIEASDACVGGTEEQLVSGGQDVDHVIGVEGVGG